MAPDQIKAFQESFTKVAPISEQAAALFYARLFEIAPSVKPLFRSDMAEQGRKPMATLAVVVNGLGNLTAYRILSDFMIGEAYGRSAAAE